MSALERSLADYLALRRSLGHELAEAAWLLPGFVAYLDARGTGTVTIEAALAWVQQSATGWATTMGPRRMTVARGFARYLSGIDRATEVPPPGLVPYRQKRRQPFIYSPAEIDALMRQARCSIVSPLRVATPPGRLCACEATASAAAAQEVLRAGPGQARRSRVSWW